MNVIVLISLAIVVIAAGAVVGAQVIATGINTAIDINEDAGGKRKHDK